MSVRITIN